MLLNNMRQRGCEWIDRIFRTSHWQRSIPFCFYGSSCPGSAFPTDGLAFCGLFISGLLPRRSRLICAVAWVSAFPSWRNPFLLVQHLGGLKVTSHLQKGLL